MSAARVGGLPARIILGEGEWKEKRRREDAAAFGTHGHGEDTPILRRYDKPDRFVNARHGQSARPVPSSHGNE
jgi:hypothetical protein